MRYARQSGDQELRFSETLHSVISNIQHEQVPGEEKKDLTARAKRLYLESAETRGTAVRGL